MRWPLWRVAVAERSMEPALHPGDWLLTWRGLNRSRPPRVQPGQLVVARHPGQPDLLLVKRAARELPGG
jgi:signal peptidase I